MELISPAYRALNQDLHDKVPSYGATSWQKHVPNIDSLICRVKPTGILDYGCGKGLLAESLERWYPWIAVQNYDPATFPEEPSPADLVVCIDVLEHIEPDRLSDVLSHLRQLSLSTLFVTISTREAKKSLPDGRNAHLIVENSEWWRDKFSSWLLESWGVGEDEIIAVLK